MIPQPLTYILLPIICALIGWLTNYIAVKMIFRPRRPVNLLGLKVQGLMPRRQHDLAVKIGETVESHLLTHDDIATGLNNPQVQEKMREVIEKEVDVFFREKLGSNPMISIFLQGDLATGVRGTLVAQLNAALPRFVDAVTGMTQDHLDLKSIVRQKIEEFDLGTLEAIVYEIASSELRLIVVLGGVLGFLVGLGQVGLLWLSG